LRSRIFCRSLIISEQVGEKWFSEEQITPAWFYLELNRCSSLRTLLEQPHFTSVEMELWRGAPPEFWNHAGANCSLGISEFVSKISLITLASRHAATISLDSSLKRADRNTYKMMTTIT
jgi:hypothetical protein